MHRGPNGQGSEEPGTSSAPTQRSIKSMTTTVSRTRRPPAVPRHGHRPLDIKAAGHFQTEADGRPQRGRRPSTTRPRPSTTRPTAVYNEADGRLLQRGQPAAVYNKATGLRQQRGRGPAATRTARPRACCNQNTRPRAFHNQNSGPSAATASLATARAVHSPRAGKISEERATPDYAAPPQTVVVRKRHWRVSPRRQLQRHSRKQWGADQSQQSRRGSQQPPARQSPVREKLPPQSREASCLATDVTGPRATQVPPAKRSRRARMTQVHQLKVEDQQPTEVESNSHFHECLNRNHLTYVRESWTWHVDAMQFYGGTHDEQLGTYVG